MGIEEVKKKREFSGLPDSIIQRALDLCEGDIKETRNFLRKYFGVFLTNRILRGKGDLLEFHKSSKGRDYRMVYGEIFEEFDEGCVIDLGCGVNGFSYGYLPSGFKYVGVEAAGQEVDLMNDYFLEEKFDARALRGDLFDVDFVLAILKKAVKPRVVFLFQVIDALEAMSRNFSKDFILKISKECERIVVSFSKFSLSGKKVAVKRNWIREWLEGNFEVVKEFETEGEKFVIIETK
jgi:RNase P protein component